MYEDVKLRLKHVLTQALRLDRAPETIPDTNLIADIGIDSINSLEFLVWVENEFDIEIADQDLSVALVDSLDQLAAYVVARAKSPDAASTNLGDNP
jgi:acyl carrier protein